MPEMLVRKSVASASTLNVETREIDAVLATETPVRRHDFMGPFDEILTVSRQAIDTARLDAMPLLDSHRAVDGLEARLGSVVPGSLRFDGKTAIVRIRLSRTESGNRVLQDLQDGHRYSVSVGYKIEERERTEAPTGGVDIMRATRWQPMELSLVNVPADPAAATRSHEIERIHEMPQATQTQTNDHDHSTRQMSVREARGFAAEFMRATNTSQFSDEVQDRIKRGMTEQDIRGLILEAMVARQEQSPTFPHSETRGRQDAQETTRQLMANAILHRHGLAEKIEDGARQFREMTPVDLARELLRQRGENAHGGSSSIIQRALHSSSDFPVILGDVARQTIMASYRKPNNTFQLIAHKNVVTDLREVKVVDIGGAPDLKLVLEGGEYTSGTISEAGEGFTMAKYGRKFGVTEELLINDQLGGIMKAVAEWGRKAAKLEGDLVWAAIINNMLKLKDGKPIFDPAHNNVAVTGTALTKENLIKARLAFRQQKDIDGEPTDISPKYLFTGSALEIDAQSLIAAAHVPTTVTDAIPQAIKSMVPIYEPRLDKIPTNAWFLFAGEEDTLGRGLQYAYLAGHEAPSFTEQIGFDVDGLEFKVKQYFGVGVTDYRFAYKNPGVDPL